MTIPGAAAVRNLERAGVPRATAMKLVGHKTEAIYRRYAIEVESDLLAGGEKLDGTHQIQGLAKPTVIPFPKSHGHKPGTISHHDRRRRHSTCQTSA